MCMECACADEVHGWGSGSGVILVIEQSDTFRLVLMWRTTVLHTCIKLVWFVVY